MCIIVCNINTFVADPIGNSNRRKALVDQKADVAVPQIVDPDALYAGFLTATLHFPPEQIVPFSVLQNNNYLEMTVFLPLLGL